MSPATRRSGNPPSRTAHGQADRLVLNATTSSPSPYAASLRRDAAEAVGLHDVGPGLSSRGGSPATMSGVGDVPLSGSRRRDSRGDQLGAHGAVEHQRASAKPSADPRAASFVVDDVWPIVHRRPGPSCPRAARPPRVASGRSRGLSRLRHSPRRSRRHRRGAARPRQPPGRAASRRVRPAAQQRRAARRAARRPRPAAPARRGRHQRDLALHVGRANARPAPPACRARPARAAW